MKAWRAHVLFAGAFVVALARTLPFCIGYHEDIDALRFALGVERFDVATLRPHAPFYPVLIAAAKLVAALGVDAVHALGVVSALSYALSVVLCGAIAGRLAGTSAARIAVLFALASPLWGLSGVKVHSDMAGTTFAVLLPVWLLLVSRRAERHAGSLRALAMIASGLGLGVRLSFFPFALALVVVAGYQEKAKVLGYLRHARDLALGVLAWLVPLIAVGSARDLVRVGLAQAEGHFERWGGTVWTVSSPTERAQGLIWGITANGFPGPWADAPAWRYALLPLLVASVVAVVSVTRRCAKGSPELIYGGVAYLAWIVVAQNIAYKPRHLLPLVALLSIVAGAGVAAQVERRRLWLGVVLGLGLGGFYETQRLILDHVVPSPAAALIAQVSERKGAMPIVTRDLGRWLREVNPALHVVEPAGDDALLAFVRERAPVLITSEALSTNTRARLASEGFGLTTVFSKPRSRYVDALWCELSLLQIDGPGPTPASGR